jgi:hypothetical protein
MKTRSRRRVLKSELCIGVQLLLDGGGHQQHRWSLPAAPVVVLVVVGRVSRSAYRPDAGGRERRRRDHKGLVVAVLETRVNSRGKPDLFVFACYSGGYIIHNTYAIDKLNQLLEEGAIIAVRME